MAVVAQPPDRAHRRHVIEPRIEADLVEDQHPRLAPKSSSRISGTWIVVIGTRRSARLSRRRRARRQN
jgi:hypothetical protein